MTRPKEITTYTPGWWYGVGHTPELRNRHGARYEPRFPLIYTLAEPFWIGVVKGWDFPREWVHSALDGTPAGVAECGGVRIVRDRAELRFELRSPDGEAVLWLPAAAVSEFLGRTLLLVPFGREGEHTDWDSLTRGSAA